VFSAYTVKDLQINNKIFGAWFFLRNKKLIDFEKINKILRFKTPQATFWQ
jgi:hypothetical protein